jgi:hypothetical protein
MNTHSKAIAQGLYPPHPPNPFNTPLTPRTNNPVIPPITTQLVAMALAKLKPGTAFGPFLDLVPTPSRNTPCTPATRHRQPPHSPISQPCSSTMPHHPKPSPATRHPASTGLPVPSPPQRPRKPRQTTPHRHRLCLPPTRQHRACLAVQPLLFAALFTQHCDIICISSKCVAIDRTSGAATRRRLGSA